MPVQSVRMRTGDPFEELVFEQVARALNKSHKPYTIASAFKLAGNREYDGLIISPTAVFTLEMKNANGSVEMGSNTPLLIRDKAGNEIESFRNRHESAFDQADMQWRRLSDYFKTSYGTDSIFVQAVLVFPDGTRFNVPAENRNFAKYQTNVLFATVSELPELVEKLQPPYPVSLDQDVQAIIARGIREGVPKLSPSEIARVAKVSPPKRPSPPPMKPPASPTPLRSSYDIAQQRFSPRPAPPPRHSNLETPIEIPPEPDSKRPSWRLPSWIYLLVGFGIVYFLYSWVAPTTAALMGAAIFTLFLWRQRRGWAIFSVVLFVSGALLFSALENVDITKALGTLFPTPTATNIQEFQPEVEIDEPGQTDNGEAKEGISATAVPNTPRLRVVGNSNVRAEPNLDSSVIGMAEADSEYDILEQTADFNWYKIRLPNGTEGWIGSTRIELIAP